MFSDRRFCLPILFLATFSFALNEDPSASSVAALKARAAADEATNVAIQSVGVTEHAQSALKIARNAVRDARASSGGLSKNQKKQLKEVEGQLHEAGLSAEYGKLQQAKWLTAKGHFVGTRETALRKLENRMVANTVTVESNEELDFLRNEIGQLRVDFKMRTLEHHVHYRTVDDRTDSDIEHDLTRLEQMIRRVEHSELKTKSGAGLSRDDLKAELERTRASINKLEATVLSSGDDVASLKLRLRALEREWEIRSMQHQLRQQLHIAITENRLEDQAHMRRQIGVYSTRQHILETELAQSVSPTEEEIQFEIKRLRLRIDQLEQPIQPSLSALNYDAHDQGRAAVSEMKGAESELGPSSTVATELESDSVLEEVNEAPVQEGRVDIDTAMPYGELEPFGREDTAQELTEQSIRESDQMVDQLERAEVSEEKRAVFRALTRLRGAAITSFDGIARSQTGNIDQYNKLNKWRRTHPLHHLADEESDISKWAFPDNADF